MSVPLKPKGKGSILTGVSMGGVGSGGAAMANSFAGMSSLGKQFVDWGVDKAVERKKEEQRARLNAAERLGQSYGSRFDASTEDLELGGVNSSGVQPLTDLNFYDSTDNNEIYEPGTIEQEVYQKSAIRAYSANIKNQFRREAKEALLNNPSDPELILNTLDKKIAAITGNALPAVADSINPDLVHIRDTIHASALESRIKIQRENTNAQLNEDTQNATNELLRLYATGGNLEQVDKDGAPIDSSNRIASLRANIEENINTQVNDGSRTQDQANELLSNLDLLSETVSKQFAVKSTFTLHGLEAALAEATKLSSLNISPAEQEKQTRKLMGTIKDVKAQQKLIADAKLGQQKKVQKANKEQIQRDIVKGSHIYTSAELTDLYTKGLISHDFWVKMAGPDGDLQKSVNKNWKETLLRNIELPGSDGGDPTGQVDRQGWAWATANQLRDQNVISQDVFADVKKKYTEFWEKRAKEGRDSFHNTIDMLEINLVEGKPAFKPADLVRMAKNLGYSSDNPDWQDTRKKLNSYQTAYAKAVTEEHIANRIGNRKQNGPPLDPQALESVSKEYENQDLSDSRTAARFYNETGHIHPDSLKTIQAGISAIDSDDEVFQNFREHFGHILNDQRGVKTLEKTLGQKYVTLRNLYDLTTYGTLNEKEFKEALKYDNTAASRRAATSNNGDGENQELPSDNAIPVLKNVPWLADKLFELQVQALREEAIAALGGTGFAASFSALGFSLPYLPGGINATDIPPLSDEAKRDFNEMYRIVSGSRFVDENTKMEAVWGRMFNNLKWGIDIDPKTGDAVWIKDQPVNHSLPVSIGNAEDPVSQNDHRRQAAKMLSVLGKRDSNGNLISFENIRFEKTGGRIRYKQYGPDGKAISETPVPLFRVLYMDSSGTEKEVPNFNYIADDQRIMNASILAARKQVRDGEIPFTQLPSYLWGKITGNSDSTLAAITDINFEAFKSMEDVKAFETHLNKFLRWTGNKEINIELDYTDYRNASWVPGDIAVRMAIDYAKMIGATGMSAGSGLAELVAGDDEPSFQGFTGEDYLNANPDEDIDYDVDAPSFVEGKDGNWERGPNFMSHPNIQSLDLTTGEPNKWARRYNSMTAFGKEETGYWPDLIAAEASGENITQVSSLYASELIYEATKKVIPNEFLENIALVESNFGNHPNTFNGLADKGIWQFTNIGLKETKLNKPDLKKARKLIKEKWGIDWAKVERSDLDTPLYSALAAALFLLSKVKEKIPPYDVNAQGLIWKKYYNSSIGDGTVEAWNRTIRRNLNL